MKAYDITVEEMDASKKLIETILFDPTHPLIQKGDWVMGYGDIVYLVDEVGSKGTYTGLRFKEDMCVLRANLSVRRIQRFASEKEIDALKVLCVYQEWERGGRGVRNTSHLSEVRRA